MGADIESSATGERLGEPVGDSASRRRRCTATTIAGDEIPIVIDEIPVLAVAAAFADGVTEVRDAAELRVKESDRIGTVQQELSPARHRGRGAAPTGSSSAADRRSRPRSRATATTASPWPRPLPPTPATARPPCGAGGPSPPPTPGSPADLASVTE